MDEKVFKPTGRFSKAWYIKIIKDNPERRGYTWIRKEHSGAPQFETLKSAIAVLVHQRFIDTVGKTDGNGSVHYQVTSLGHRYLEENKDALIGEEIHEAQQRINKKTEEIATEGLKQLENIPGTLSYEMNHGDSLLGKKMKVTDTPKFQQTFEDPIEDRVKRDRQVGFVMVYKDNREPTRSSAAPDEYDIDKNPIDLSKINLGSEDARSVMVDNDNHIRSRAETETSIKGLDPMMPQFDQEERREAISKVFDDLANGPVPEIDHVAMARKIEELTPDPALPNRHYILRDIIGDALLEKFGDQMSVKELLRYAEEDR
jgi:DNA-binding PadR family transcriptional regulator